MATRRLNSNPQGDGTLIMEKNGKKNPHNSKTRGLSWKTLPQGDESQKPET